MESKAAYLMNACHLALGWIVAKGGPDDPVAITLAKAMRENGSLSTYVDDIIEQAEKK